jgi:hypothetical protein
MYKRLSPAELRLKRSRKPEQYRRRHDRRAPNGLTKILTDPDENRVFSRDQVHLPVVTNSGALTSTTYQVW